MLAPDALSAAASAAEKDRLDELFFTGSSFFESESLRQEFSRYETYREKWALRVRVFGKQTLRRQMVLHVESPLSSTVVYSAVAFMDMTATFRSRPPVNSYSCCVCFDGC